MVEKVSDFFSWERKPLVSSPNLSFLKVKIHFVNKKVISHPFRLLHFLHVGRPQNRSGIRNSLTRSDLVLGRRLVQRVRYSHFLSKKDKTQENDVF
jgi:hypothetical protein